MSFLAFVMVTHPRQILSIRCRSCGVPLQAVGFLAQAGLLVQVLSLVGGLSGAAWGIYHGWSRYKTLAIVVAVAVVVLIPVDYLAWLHGRYEVASHNMHINAERQRS